MVVFRENGVEEEFWEFLWMDIVKVYIKSFLRVC